MVSEKNGSILEIYDNEVNTNYVTTGVDNNYNSYNSNDTACEDITNDDIK